MRAHSTHDKVKIRILSLVENFFGWVRTVGIVYGYTMFLDRAKLELQLETDTWVLETGSVFELFYEWTTMKKMKDPWSS